MSTNHFMELLESSPIKNNFLLSVHIVISCGKMAVSYHGSVLCLNPLIHQYDLILSSSVFSFHAEIKCCKFMFPETLSVICKLRYVFVCVLCFRHYLPWVQNHITFTVICLCLSYHFATEFSCEQLVVHFK